ncbi:tRNA pseudouridine synthase B [Arenicella chitinivorans]|uniref:tRNA pseudouridine synthase B n=1 Tax=Arenicella chitinivorans TaxID=1329800 RepID=A0A918RRR3_9GAMM|nr:tRNA pseudouridine(55) synthase TruB [Arenicella chitinivorans]GHA08487.1 tRNA pseudouridine synthase B [Arenicella chitinivorans]
MQYRSKKRDIHGVILLDKPTGMSSNKALQRVKSRFQARKAGHTGSLDPLATGLLPICLGQATKVCEYFLHSHKRYSTVIKLGVITDTWDADGEVLETHMVNVSDQVLQASLEQFRGQIQQVPPMFSALKKNGQPLYKLARRGEEIERESRTMTVHALHAERLDHDLVRLDVHCSSGFYIRSLAYDLGQILGCGAHVTELRRTESKGISVRDALSLDQIEQADLADILLPIDTLLQDFPSVQLSAAQIESLRQGRPTSAGELTTSALSRFVAQDGALFAVGEVLANGILKTHKMFVYD